jgi:hypothetical protein
VRSFHLVSCAAGHEDRIGNEVIPPGFPAGWPRGEDRKRGHTTLFPARLATRRGQEMRSFHLVSCAAASVEWSVVIFLSCRLTLPKLSNLNHCIKRHGFIIVKYRYVYSLLLLLGLFMWILS